MILSQIWSYYIVLKQYIKVRNDVNIMLKSTLQDLHATKYCGKNVPSNTLQTLHVQLLIFMLTLI